MPNFSGRDHVLINTLERAVSTDINSLQQRSAKATSLTMQRQANDLYEWDNGRGKATETTVNDNPLQAEVLGGLLVTVNDDFLLVDPGTLSVKATTSGFASTKDSDLIIVQSAGVTDSLILPFLANSDGVDVVECQVVELITSTESRDIYDPVTGLFTASLVTKAAEATLNFRIRQGASGAGFPGTASGWLPLVVAVHAVGSVNNTNVDFYDVRPMANERTSNPSRVGVPQQLQMGQRCDWAGVLDTGNFNVSGTFYVPWGVGPNSSNLTGGGYRLHGQIGPTLPGTTNDVNPATQRLKMNDSAIWDPGDASTAAAVRWSYLVTMQPFNLPRWCRYTTGVTRKPGLNMGLYVATVDSSSQVKSSGVLLAVGLPTAYRLGADTGITAARVIAAFEQPVGADMTAGHCTGGLFRSGEALRLVSRTSFLDAGDTISNAFNIGKPGDLNGFLPGGVIGLEVNVNFFFAITTPSPVSFNWIARDTTNSVDLQRKRLQGFAQYPISTDRVHFAQVEFAFPSEESPNESGTGNLGDILLTFEMGFDSGAGASDGVTASSMRLHGVRFGWA